MSGNPNNNANIGFVGEGNRNIDYLNDDNQNLGFVNEHNANIGFDERKHNIGVVNDGDHNIGVVSDSHGNTGFINEGPSRFAPAMPQPPVGADFDRVLASLHELHPDYFFNQGLDSVIEADDVFNVGPMFANVPQPKRSAEPTQETRQVRRRVQTTAAPPPFPALGNIPSGTAEASVKAPEPLSTLNAADCFKTPLVTLLVGLDQTRIHTHKGFLDRSEYFKKRLAENDSPQDPPNELKLVKETPEDVYKMVAWLCLGKYEPKAINPASANANRDYLDGLISDYGLASKYGIQAIRTQIVVGNPNISDVSWDHLVQAADLGLRGTRMWICLMMAVRSDSFNRPEYLEKLLWDGLTHASDVSSEYETDDDDAMSE